MVSGITAEWPVEEGAKRMTKPESNDLLSCPFCGSEMSREQRLNRSGNLIWMAYHPGGKSCILGGMNFDIKKWNTRTR